MVSASHCELANQFPIFISIYRKARFMITDKAIPDNCSHTPVNGGLQKFASAFIIPIPCVLCEDKLVKVGDTYDLVDFLDNGELYVRSVKFMNAYMRGYVVVIVVLDMKAGELIKRRHRLNNDILPCNWVLTDLFSTNRKKDELLEFEF
jgi:hypothetical protein